MSFRSVDHSSPVTVTLSSEQTEKLIARQVDSSVLKNSESHYDDSSLRATIAHLQGEISFLSEQLKENKKQLDEQPEAKDIDYTWLSKELNDFKEIIKSSSFNKEILDDLWGEKFLRALTSVIPEPKEVHSIVFPDGIPTDPVLRACAIISSFALVTIPILLMLQYTYN